MTPHAELPAYIDSTMISCFRRCPQQFFKEFILGLRPTGLSVDLHAGGCFASALENVYRGMWKDGKDFSTALRDAYRQYLVDWGDFIPNKDTPKTREGTWAAVEDYFTTYPPAQDPVQPYFLPSGDPAFEFTFSIPLLPIGGSVDNPHDSAVGFPLHPVTKEPFLYSGRFDMLGNYCGLPCVRDEKTTKSIASNWSEQWDLRSQFMGYVWACQQSGIDLDTCVVRGVGILKTKFHQVQAVKQYPKYKVERWHEQLRRDLWRLVSMWNEGYWDYNFADACSTYGGCAFLPLCNSKDETAWYGNYTSRRWNPTLKNPIAEPTPCPKL